MMRRGPLADHPIDVVLQTAARERLNGQIDIEGHRLAHIHLLSGAVALASWDGAALPADLAFDAAHTRQQILTAELRCRALTVSVLASVLDQADGWYHHHPLAEPPDVQWAWPVDGVLADARALRDAWGDEPIAPPTPAAPVDPTPVVPTPEAPEAGSVTPAAGGRRWALAAEPPAEHLDRATWAVVAAMAGNVRHSDLVGRLGLSAEQADVVIGPLVRRGLLRAEGAPVELLGGRVRSRAG